MSYLTTKDLEKLSIAFRALQKDYETHREELPEDDPFPIYYQAQFRQLLYDYASKTVFEYMGRDATEYQQFVGLVRGAINYFEVMGSAFRSSKPEPTPAPTTSGFGSFGFNDSEVPF